MVRFSPRTFGLALVTLGAGGLAAGGCAKYGASVQESAETNVAPAAPATHTTGAPVMFSSDPALRLGNFSVSLAVKDLAASRAFYEKLGFQMVSGNGKSWVVMRNENTKIGLFQGMFDKNILTFNPGWDSDKNTLPDFVDVRDLQKTLQSRGIALTATADEKTTGPAFFTLTDPDGNQILVDQHVGK